MTAVWLSCPDFILAFVEWNPCQCGQDGAEPLSGITNPGGPHPPTSVRKLTGDAYAGLSAASW
jgi:hypothetical protein